MSTRSVIAITSTPSPASSRAARHLPRAEAKTNRRPSAAIGTITYEWASPARSVSTSGAGAMFSTPPP